MAAIQAYPDLLDYVNAMLHPLGKKSGSYLELFLHACLRADRDNFELLRPVLEHYTMQYPANEDRLKMERIDRGLGG